VNDLMAFHGGDDVAEVGTLAPDVAPSIINLVQRCLSKKPHDRFQDALDLRLALRSLLGSLRSLDRLLAEALDGESVETRNLSDKFEIVVSLPQGRSQKVFVELVRPSSDVELVRIYSVCGVAVAHEYEHALQMNAVIPHGALAIETIDGERCFVAVDTYPRATCDPLELRESVLAIAANADRLESQLHDEDRY